MLREHGRFVASQAPDPQTRFLVRHVPKRGPKPARLPLSITAALLLVLAIPTGTLGDPSESPAAPGSAPTADSLGAKPTTSDGASTSAAAPATAAPSRPAPGTPGPDDGSAPAPAHAIAVAPATGARTARASAHASGLGASDGAVSAAASAASNVAPTHFDDVTPWIEYRAHNHIGALPQESRIFFRRGLQLYTAGNFDEAVRTVRGACDLDADYVAPHLTLASWFLLREPSQALLQIAAALDLARENFVMQLALLANVLVVAIQSLFLALLAAAVMLLVMRNAQLRHVLQERLGTFVELRGARIWAWGLIVLPFLCGFGLALPTLLLLGILWPILRVRERVVVALLTVMVAAAPWLGAAIDRMTVPLRPDQGPFFGIPELAAEPYSPERQQQINQLSDRYPDDAFAHFALGWLARRGGDLALSERAYRRALQIWPHDDRVLNNLGNTLAMQGRSDDALAMYQRAYAGDPHNAAAYFNASQIFTQRYEYKAASDALQRASALNFDLVKAYQAQATEDGMLPLVDQWLAPSAFWTAMPAIHVTSTGGAMLPPGWRARWETSGWLFSVVTLLLAIGAVLLGGRLHADMPLRACSNCGCVVCRRCAERRRETALCSTCAATESQAESAEFARVLLMQRRRGVQRRWRMSRTALATLIPGFGMLALDRLLVPVMLLSLAAGLCGTWLGLGAPFSYEPRLLAGAHDGAMWTRIAMWVAIYAVSLLGYLAAQSRERKQFETAEPAGRSRGGEPPRRVTAAAA